MMRAVIDRPMGLILKAITLIYRTLISPFLAPSCRFQPSCSQYALDAVRHHGGIRGGWLTLRRLSRCHPWGGCGHDPVPDNPHLAERTR